MKLALAIVLLSSVAHAAPIALNLDDSLRCPSAIALHDALVKQIGPERITDGVAAVTLTVTQTDSARLLMALSDSSGEQMTRELNARGVDCAALADTAALVVDSWLRELPWKSLAPPPSAPASTPAQTNASPTPIAPAPATFKTKRDPFRHFLHLTLQLSGGGAVALTSSPPVMGAGRLALELGVGRHFGVGASAGVTSAYTNSPSGGAVEIRRVPFIFFGKLALHAFGKSGFALFAGFDLDVSTVATSGFSATAGSATYLDPAIWLAADWEWAFSRRFFLSITPAFTILLRTDRVQVPGVGEVTKTHDAWFDLQVGLGCRFF